MKNEPGSAGNSVGKAPTDWARIIRQLIARNARPQACKLPFSENWALPNADRARDLLKT